jgi:RHS repeat-associated protein
MGTWSYTYDNLNRLVSGTPASGPYTGQYTCWSYDSFGNRTSQSVSTTPCTGTPPATFAAIYDAEGRVCALNGPEGMFGYQYDADGARVGKGTVTNWQSCDITSNGYTPTTEYVLDQGGGQMTEVAVGNGPVHANVTANGTLIATLDGAGWHFYLNDALGSRRAQTDAAGFPEQTCQSLPFGDQLYCSGSLNNPTEHHFTGKERDTESGLDYFGARYYSSNMGRFSSPDDGSDQDPSDPQSWNLYGYVRNNPANKVDEDGRSVQICGHVGFGSTCVTVSDDVYKKSQEGNGSLKVPTLDQVGMNGDGNGQFNPTPITDSDGNTVGTATYVNTDGGSNYYANRNGFDTLSTASKGVTQVTAVYAGVYGAVGAAIVGGPAVATVARMGLQRLALGATAPALVNLINRIYQAQDEIPGGTAGAVRNEVMTGEFINGGHSIKAAEMITALSNLIKSGTLSGSDQMIAGHIISDLKNSLGR